MSTQVRNNDFTIRIANVNGTGSASANTLLMKAFFRMGIPVAGKNYFPSNIQGLPTWYEIRVSDEGYICRSGRVDIMVAMNAQTYQKDLAAVSPGGYLLYDSTWPRDKQLAREDISVFGVPLSRMCNERFTRARERVLMKNIAYVGVLAALLDIDVEAVKTLLRESYGAKPQLLDGNQLAFDLGYDYAREHFPCPLPIRARAAGKTAGHIMVDGNTTAAMGALFAGATVVGWYPITPSTSVIDSFKSMAERWRRDPQTGRQAVAIVQAEDELAAIGMVLGAGWNGARAFTSTSGPGISLMSEFLGYGYFTEIPAVLINVQRCGPSTGMPTRTQQGDILACAYASHGDTRHVLLFPANPEEAFYLTAEAFNLAERLQTPVMVLTDLDIGMNDWMCPELKWDAAYQPDRGKVMSAEQLEKIEKFHRYLDVDGDGIPWRSLPGVHPKGAYFTRGSGHNRWGTYTEDAAEYRDLVDRLLKKWETARTLVPPALIDHAGQHRVGIVSVGTCDGAVHEARDRLAATGMHANYLRVRAFPFGSEVREFLDAHERIYVVEQNRDAQLRSLLLIETGVEQDKLVPVLHYDGMPVSADDIIKGINQDVLKGKAA